jgi:uncharacterized cupin superfamily protein
MKRALIQVLMLLVAAELSVFGQTGSGILRFEPNGPGGAGLKGNDRDSSKIYHYYKSKADERVAAGIWSSPDFSGRMRKVDSTEFIYILEGAVTLLDKSGREETFKAGDAVLIPRGTEFQWKKSDKLKEYWVIFDRDVAGTPAPQGTPTFFRLDRDGAPGKGLTGSGRTKSYQYYKGADGSSVGVWETQPHTSPNFHQTKYAELMVFLSGNVTLTTPAGQTEKFKAGDVALVPKGIDYKWSSDTTRKFWVIFDNEPPERPSTVPKGR